MDENIQLLARLILQQRVIVFAGPDLITIKLLPEEQKLLSEVGNPEHLKLMDYLALRVITRNKELIEETHQKISDKRKSEVSRKFSIADLYINDKNAFDLNQILHLILYDEPQAYSHQKPHQIVREEINEIFELEDGRMNMNAIKKLAQILPIKLFFNTSGINVLRHNLGVYREKCSFYNFYNGNLHEDVTNEESNYNDLDHTILYNLFGNTDSFFCLTEMDYVDFVFKYHENRRKHLNLKNLIDDNDLIYLFLGCNIPNWLFRFFIRAFTEKNVKSIGSKVMFNEYPEDLSNSAFFNRNYIKYLHQMNPAELVDNLFDEIQQLEPKAINARKTEKLVFISYASEDKKRVEFIYQQISNAGIDVWFDIEGGIRSGDLFRDKIIDGINRTAIFIPIISKKSETGDKDRHYRKEWEYARAKFENNELQVMPVRLDQDVENNALGIPEWIWRHNVKDTNYDCLIPQNLVDEIKQKQEEQRYATA